MSLSLPIYKRGQNYVLHLRIKGRQVKRSLATPDPAIARVRAIQLLSEVLCEARPQNGSNNINIVATKNSHTELHEHAIVEPFQAQELHRQREMVPSVFVPKVALVDKDKFRLAVVLKNYSAVRKIKDVTKYDYASYAKEIIPFFKNKDIRTLTEADISDLILHLRTELGNDPRTIDNKVGYLRAVINHLIKHGQFVGANPASAKNLVSKRERRKSGTKPIAYNDLKVIFGSDQFRQLRETKASIYLITMVGLCTGMRVSSVARLQPSDLKVSMKGTTYIDISADKTVAGNRDIPIPQKLFDAVKSHLSKRGGFGLGDRGEKGYSDSVNKPIKAFLKEHNFDHLHEKLSFHAFRKSFNDHLLRLGVERHICGALLGHVDESMTTGVYALPPSVDLLKERVGMHQEEILKYLEFLA